MKPGRRIVEDAARGKLKDIYAPVDEFGKERKPSLQAYPEIPWDKINLDQFNLLPGRVASAAEARGGGWGTFRIIPVESGRGCPYGCEFCTVTGFFGDSIRFRTNESVVNELLLLKARARSEGGQIAVFFIDDNFAINVKRTKSLLRDIIAANAQVHWVAQISANLLRDEELVDLIAAAGGKWIFIGMESIDPANLADVKKGFNKPGEYAAVLDRLAQRNVYAITSFIFGMDNDTPGVAERTLKEIRNWPPGLPIFGLLTPLPATPLYKRLEAAGRLTRPKHWQEFMPFAMAHTPLKMTIDEAHAEVRIGWANSYSPEAIEQAVRFAQPQAAGLSHQHPDRAPVFPGNLFPANGPLRMGENDSSESAHNCQTDQAGVRCGDPCSGARCRRAIHHGAAKLNHQLFLRDEGAPQKIGFASGKASADGQLVRTLEIGWARRTSESLHAGPLGGTNAGSKCPGSSILVGVLLLGGCGPSQ